MAILRAGPWAIFNGDSFVDAPEDFDTAPDQSPVNCASSNWANDTWKTLWVHLDPTFLDAGVAALGERVEIATAGDDLLFMEFHYQATVDFDIDVDWEETGSGTAEWDWDSSTIEGDSDFNLGAGEGSGTETITLKASTLGVLYFQLLRVGVGSLSLTIRAA